MQPVYDGLTGWDTRRQLEKIEAIMFYRDERLALFIDGSNLYAATKALGFEIDYKLLRSEFMRRGKMDVSASILSATAPLVAMY